MAIFNPYSMNQLAMPGISSGFRKITVKEEDIKIFKAMESLWEKCKEYNEVPTQIILGSEVFRKALNDPQFLKYYKELENRDLNSSGLVGFLTTVQVLTDFYKGQFDNYGWTIEDNVIAFNMGAPLLGDI